MGSYEATRMVFSRIQSLEPENVSKIIGYLLLQDLGEEEMIRLAFGSNALLQSMISKAKKDLGLYPQFGSTSVSLPHQFRWEILHPQHDYRQTFSLNLNRHQSLPSDHKFSVGEEALNKGLLPHIHGKENQHRRSYSMTDFSHVSSPKPCIYFARGYCKHGLGCRFSHSFEGRARNVVGDTVGVTRQPLERVESEIQELLRGRRTPVSIASLPQLYYERFGKVLQADGYLTESQRHGKCGYSLTNLLARLKNTVTVIDRPHGQHAVVLAEDAENFRIERDAGAGCKQIYMTFPADSTFTEEDVSNYFRIYGPVQDVRIPYQQKRMFGFVTYVFSETVKLILSKGNPHYICGARVLVKPYKEKTRKVVDRTEPQRCFPTSYALDVKGSDFSSGPGTGTCQILAHTRMEQHEQTLTNLELERIRFANFNIGERTLSNLEKPSSFSLDSMTGDTKEAVAEATSASEDFSVFDFQTEQFRYLLDVLDSEQNDTVDSNSNDKEECFAEKPLLTSNASGVGAASSSSSSSHPERKTQNFSILNDPIRESSIPKIPLWSGCR